MTDTTKFIGELVRGANSPSRLTDLERHRLLERGRSTAKALRGLIAKTGKPIPIEIAKTRPTQIKNAAQGQPTDRAVAQALLALAEEIRQLRIIKHG